MSTRVIHGCRAIGTFLWNQASLVLVIPANLPEIIHSLINPVFFALILEYKELIFIEISFEIMAHMLALSEIVEVNNLAIGQMSQIQLLGHSERHSLLQTIGLASF